MLYVGVDAHKATSQITVINETGSILKRAKASTSSAFQQALSEYDEPLTAVFEASYCWGPIYDWLDDLHRGSGSGTSVEGQSHSRGPHQNR